MPKETLGCGEKLSRLEPERPPRVRFPPLYEVGRNDPVFFQLEIDGRAFKAEQGFRAVRAADLAARPLKDIAQIALLKFRDRGKIRDDEGPRLRSGCGCSAGRHQFEQGRVQDDSPLDDVLEFPYIAGPGIVQEAGPFRIRKPEGWPAVALAVGFRERLREPDDVLPALAQGGDPQGDHGKPVEEIFTEASFGDLIAQIPVGGGDEAEPGYDFGGASHTHEPLVLEHA